MLRTLLLAIGLAVGLGAEAQVRSIPAQAKAGQIRHVQESIVEIGGKRMMLSAGAQIRDAQNRVVLPTSIPPGALARYTLDSAGLVHRVWLLSQPEALQLNKGR